MQQAITPPEYTVRVLNKQTSKGWRVDEVSVTLRFTEPLDGSIVLNLQDHLSFAHLAARNECDRPNHEEANRG